MSVAASAAYYDFGELASLRGEAARAPGQALSEVAGQFESLFTQMMLKSMRDATLKDDLFGSNQMELYQSMLDQQLSLQISSQSGLGLADVLVEQLEGTPSVGSAVPAPTNSLAAYGARVRAHLPPVDGGQGVTALAPGGSSAETGADVAPASSVSAAQEDKAWSPQSIAEFVGDIWDGAVSAAQELGLDPRVLVAQSALETGWGKRVIKAIDGASSFNLFGIKSGAGWRGANATVETLEYREGIAAKERASFRVYDSLASSFQDYVSFLKGNPRYQQALESVSDSKAFVQGLQEAGYATDPNYAKKIINIMHNPTLVSVLETLKK